MKLELMCTVVLLSVFHALGTLLAHPALHVIQHLFLLNLV